MYLNPLQPSIELVNVRIDEPVTTATDLIMTAVCLYAFFRIRKLEGRGKLNRLFQYYFLTLALGAFFGGILGHGFLYLLAPPWKLVSWVLILISVAIMVHTLIDLAKPLMTPLLPRWLVGINLLVLFSAACITIWTIDFAPVTYYSVFGMFLAVGSLSLFIFRKTGNRSMVWFLGSVGLGLVAAVVYSFRCSFSPWFNHNDLGHLIVICSVLGLFMGATQVLKNPDTIS